MGGVHGVLCKIDVERVVDMPSGKVIVLDMSSEIDGGNRGRRARVMSLMGI